MKKNKLIILLTLFLMMPLFVKADMAAPSSSYKVRISNPKGAEIYELNEKDEYKKTGKKLNYDEIYTVRYEEIHNNELYIDVELEKIDEDGEKYHDIITIKFKDTKLTEVKLKDYKQEEKIKFYVFDDSCYLYKGPSVKYGKINPETSLSIGTIIETAYYDEMWAYVEHNGQKGWVYTYSYSRENSESAGMVAIYDDYYYEKIKTLEETVMYKSPKTNEKLGVTIPKEIELKIIYSYSIEVKMPYYYVEYNGTKGWIKTIRDEDWLITNIAYERVKGEYEDLVVKDENGITFYSKANNKDTAIGKIPYQTKVIPTYYLMGSHYANWFFIEYNGKKGWVDAEEFYDDEEDMVDDEEDIQDKDEVLDDEDIVAEPDESIDNDSSPENDNDGEKSINEIIIYYACGVIILSLTAVVTIILINKKKKEKNVNK